MARGGAGGLEISDLVQLEAAVLVLEKDVVERSAAREGAGAVARAATRTADEAEQEVADLDSEISSWQAERNDAKERVASLTKSQLNEVKALKGSPPVSVRRAMESVWVVLNSGQWAKSESRLKALDLSQEWTKVQRMLTTDDFVQSVIAFDPAQLDAAPWVVDFVTSRYFPELAQAAPSRTPPGSPSAAAAAAVGSSASSPALARSPSGVSRSGSTAALAAGRASGSVRGSSLRSAGRAAISAASQPSASAQPLDLAAVERASKASGALVRWCLQVVREFHALRSLRERRSAASARAARADEEAKARRREEEQREAELRTSEAERNEARDRLARLKEEARRAEEALLQLRRLEQLEEQFSDQSRSGTWKKTFGEPQAPPAPAPAPRRRPEPAEAKDFKLERVSDFMRFVEKARAAGRSDPDGAEEAPAEGEDADDGIVIEIPQPATLGALLAAPSRRPARTEPAAADGGDAGPWFVEFGYNEEDVCVKGSPFLREQRKACEALAKHLSSCPEAVVLLEGFSSGGDEDADVGLRRAESLAAWLRRNGARDAQIRVQMPPRPPSFGEEDGEEDDEAPAPLASCSAEGAAEDAVDEAEEEEEEEDDEVDEEEADGSALPWRRVEARPLREVRVLEGPSEGDEAQRSQPGLYFAPEDHAVDSLGGGLGRVLRHLARELRSLVGREGAAPSLPNGTPWRPLVVIEGHSDEGVSDEYLLDWLAEKRAVSVRDHLVAHACRPLGQKRSKASAADAKGQDSGGADQAGSASKASASVRGDAQGARRRTAAEAAPERGGRTGSAATTAEAEEEASAEEPPEDLPFLRRSDFATCSRGRRCWATNEWGRRGLNRRVQIFVL